MRLFDSWALILVGGLFAAPALAGITPWSESQDARSRSAEVHVSVLGALAMPQGAFGRTSGADAGLARIGGGVGLDVTSRFRSGIETGALLWFDTNPTDIGPLERSLRAFLTASGYAGDSLRLESSAWMTGWALGKVGYAPRGASQVRAFVDLYGGLLYTRTPKVEALTAPTGVTFIGGQEPWYGYGLGAGGGLRWRERLSVGLLYLSGSASHEDTFARATFHQPVSVLHLTLGYSF